MTVGFIPTWTLRDDQAVAMTELTDRAAISPTGRRAATTAA